MSCNDSGVRERKRCRCALTCSVRWCALTPQLQRTRATLELELADLQRTIGVEEAQVAELEAALQAAMSEQRRVEAGGESLRAVMRPRATVHVWHHSAARRTGKPALRWS